MLTGTAPVDDLLAHATTMPAFDVGPAELGEVELLKVTYETSMASRTAALPPGLHPCNPPVLVLHVWSVGESPWGPFAMAEARIGCRSGTRPRGLVLGCVVDRAEPAAALAAGWGFPVRSGEVELRRQQPDLSNVVIEYEPGDWCVESKSLKLYLWSFRDRAVFAEALAAEIAQEIERTAKPRWVKVTLTQRPRGGIEVQAVAEL